LDKIASMDKHYIIAFMYYVYSDECLVAKRGEYIRLVYGKIFKRRW